MADQERSRSDQKNKGGRPTKIQDARDTIIRLIRAGNYIETAAAAAGVNKVTFYRWLKRGARSKSGMYRDFRDDVLQALAQSESLDLETIRKASAEQWQAAAWRLERRFPQRWRQRNTTAIELPGETVEEADELTAVLEGYAEAFNELDSDDEAEEGST